MNAVDNDLEINDGIVGGVLSSANSQTPFLLPKSNSSSSQTYQIPNYKEEHHDVQEELPHKAAIVDNLAMKGTYKLMNTNNHRECYYFCSKTMTCNTYLSCKMLKKMENTKPFTSMNTSISIMGIAMLIRICIQHLIRFRQLVSKNK